MKTLRPRLTFANVVSCLALFVALGGSAYAATQLPKNSVGTKQLKDGAVTQAKLAKGVGAGAGERGTEGRQGPVGPQGSPGAPGSPGTPGGSGATHVVVRRALGNEFEAVANCEPGEVATGGGGFTDTEAQGGGFLASSEPVQNAGGEPTGWEVSGSSADGQAGFPVAYVVCVSP
jgi:hypothetical protein